MLVFPKRKKVFGYFTVSEDVFVLVIKIVAVDVASADAVIDAVALIATLAVVIDVDCGGSISGVPVLNVVNNVIVNHNVDYIVRLLLDEHNLLLLVVVFVFLLMLKLLLLLL